MDLKTAVESGRRWRHAEWIEACGWAGPGASGPKCQHTRHGSGEVANMISIEGALSSDFEIEPEPEPEKPRRWMMFQSPNGDPHCAGCQAKTGLPVVIVHDADACDRQAKELAYLHPDCPTCRAVYGESARS